MTNLAPPSFLFSARSSPVLVSPSVILPAPAPPRAVPVLAFSLVKPVKYMSAFFRIKARSFVFYENAGINGILLHPDSYTSVFRRVFTAVFQNIAYRLTCPSQITAQPFSFLPCMRTACLFIFCKRTDRFHSG